MDLFDYAKNENIAEKNSDQEEVFSVSQITIEIKHLLAHHFASKHPIVIEGEVSNYKGRNSAGHMYFSLKDESSILPCVFFRFANAKAQIPLKEGSLVQAKGKIEVYEKGGRYQFVIESISEKGQGQLFEKFLQLKSKLQTEGLFDQARKKPIPSFARRIGVVTSATGSVIKDIIHVIEKRAPVVDIVLFPCKVQGDDAAKTIVEQIELASEAKFQIDVLIVGRGGGSIEDLWPFNEEIVARAVAQCSIPIISAVGHQTDFTICDFVADVRAATPSQAAEFAVPDTQELRKQLLLFMQQMGETLQSKLAFAQKELIRWMAQPVMRDPRAPLTQRMQFLDELTARLKERLKHVTPLHVTQLRHLQKQLIVAQNQRITQSKSLLSSLSAQLKVLDPKNVLSRGYSIVRLKNQKIISHLHQVKIEDEVLVKVSDGEFECTVTKT
ncbi:MAG: exodeoxyribonuclease VII large subunit [Bdellovibrionales bacterium]|nr:exodeoxyribonuclease VII large subunit [Bdellovibrionales bacterium]